MLFRSNRVSPARNAGLKVGDSIIEINGEKIVSSEQVVDILNESKDKEVELLVLRNKGEFKTLSSPIKCLQDNAYRLGIWVRDKTSGIGTMTFYHEESDTFGALGHGITDVDTGFGNMTPVDVVIRPEDIDLLEPGKGTIDGVVTHIIFKGVHYEMEVTTPDGFEWLVHSTDMFPVGTKVSIHVDPFDIQIMNKPESEDEEAIAVEE